MNSVLFDQDRGWFTRGRVLTLSLALATLLMLFACYRIVKPFVPGSVSGAIRQPQLSPSSFSLS
jgi:hypothetical protein